MKTISFVALIVTILLTGGCEKNKEIDLKSKFIGEWVELEPCNGCNLYQFTSDTIYFIDQITEVIKIPYSVISNDSITVKWPSLKSTCHKYVFYSKDSIKLFQFMPVDYGINKYIDIVLIKKNE